MKTLLVTGGQGQVGRELERIGQARGLRMICVDRDQLDITDPSAVAHAVREHKPDAMINAAAYTAVDRAEAEESAAYAVNRDGAAHLARAAREADIPFLHISTDYVFSGTSSRPFREDDATAPASVYGRSKLAGDEAVLEAYPRTILLRVAWVFGALGHNFVKTMLGLGRSGREQLNIVDDQRGGPTWAGDIASALLDIQQQLDRGQSAAGIYHYCGAPETSWHGFATSIFSSAVELGLLANAPRLNAIPTSQYPTPATRPAYSSLDCQRIRETFGISQPDWRIGLRETLLEISRQENLRAP